MECSESHMYARRRNNPRRSSSRRWSRRAPDASVPFKASAPVAYPYRGVAKRGRFNPWSQVPVNRSHSCTLRYSTYVSLDPAVGLPADYVFSLNSLYDPDVTGIGHQPYGFDQLMALYNHYTVVGARVMCSVAPSREIPCWFGLVIKDDSLSLASSVPEYIRERPGAHFKLIAKQGSQSAEQLILPWSAKGFFKKRAIVGDSLYRGSVNTGPQEQAYVHIVMMPQENVSDILSTVVQVDIEYYAVFTEPQTLANS